MVEKTLDIKVYSVEGQFGVDLPYVEEAFKNKKYE